jgi:hypothetical protein
MLRFYGFLLPNLLLTLKNHYISFSFRLCSKGCYFQPSRDTYTYILCMLQSMHFNLFHPICAGSEGGNATRSFGIWFQGHDGHVFESGILTSGTREPICEHKYKCSHMARFRRLYAPVTLPGTSLGFSTISFWGKVISCLVFLVTMMMLSSTSFWMTQNWHLQSRTNGFCS